MLKIDLKMAKIAKLGKNAFGSVLFVAMATSHVILQRFLFLNQVKQELHSKNDAMNYCDKVQKLIKIDLNIAKLAKFDYIFAILYYLLPLQLGI